VAARGIFWKKSKPSSTVIFRTSAILLTERLCQRFTLIFNLEGFAIVAFTFADIALDVDIGEEVHLDNVDSLSATGFTASTFDVEGKLSCFVAACFCFDGLGEDFADGIEYARIGDGIRSIAIKSISIQPNQKMPTWS
jgi:hypothetical protein